MTRLLLVLALAVAGSVCAAELNGHSPLGTNLSPVADWSREWAFVDAFKASRPWISGAASGTWDDRRAIATDADGWVTSLQPGQIARTLLFWDLDGAYPGGKYTVLYDGEGVLQFGGAARVAESRPGRIVLQVEPKSGGIMLNLAATTAGNPVRNIRVLMPGGICDGEPFRHVAGASACKNPRSYRSFEQHHAQIVFHPQFLERIRTYRVLRYMDWGATNNSQQAAWAERPKPGDARWSVKGVPVEIMLQLANRIGADPWFTLPHQADDDYVRQFAKTVKESLGADLKTYVEYSNEVWNNQFAQAEYARRRGVALGLSRDAYQAGRRFYAKRSVEIFRIWSAELADPRRLVRVIASQAVNLPLSTELLDYQDAKRSADALAIAPYFGGQLQAQAAAWTLDRLFAELRSSMPAVIDSMTKQAALARTRGVPLIAYEGGQHLAGHGGAENIAALNALFDAANRDARMGTLYRGYLDAWKKAGGRVFVHFSNCSAYTKWGRWGALEHLEQPRAAAPKFDALQDFAERNPPWW